MSTITYIFILLAIIACADSKLTCPGYGFIRPQEPCVNQCSPGNDTCGSGKKCCYTPETSCGNRRLVGKDNVAKPGTCPPSQSDQSDPLWRLCDGHFCDVDNDCRCKQKCCPNKCSSLVCIAHGKKRS